jgi:hypothetical protein
MQPATPMALLAASGACNEYQQLLATRDAHAGMPP